MRIVSLLASATEMVCALGAGEMLVGRSHECDNPEWVRRLPACSLQPSMFPFPAEKSMRRFGAGSQLGNPFITFDDELIRELRADLLITQSHCEVCAVTPGDLERSGACSSRRAKWRCRPRLWTKFSGILRIASGTGLEERGEAVISGERERLDRVREKAARFRRPTVIMLEWTDPLFAMGNWGPELVEIANGELLLGKKASIQKPSPPTSFETPIRSI